MAVDTDGRLLMANLTEADVQDAAEAEAIIKAIRRRWPWLRHLIADSANQQGFVPLPRRWVVEQTFGWMVRWRRLVPDYKSHYDISEAMIYLSMDALLTRRFAHP